MGEIPKKMVVTSFIEKNLIFQNLMKLKEPLKNFGDCNADPRLPTKINQ